MSKLIESFESNLRLYSELEKLGYDIDLYNYWKTNPYFQNLEQLKEYFEK